MDKKIEIANILGIEPGEEFTVQQEHGNPSTDVTYRIDNSGLRKYGKEIMVDGVYVTPPCID